MKTKLSEEKESELRLTRQSLAGRARIVWEKCGKPGFDPHGSHERGVTPKLSEKVAFDQWRTQEATLAMGLRLSKAPPQAYPLFARHLRNLEEGRSLPRYALLNMEKIHEACKGFRTDASWLAYASAIACRRFKKGLVFFTGQQTESLVRMIHAAREREQGKTLFKRETKA